jgi:hypothetical protein
LDVSDNIALTDASLFSLAEGCINLRSLNIYRCCKLTSESIISIIRSLKNLHELISYGLSVTNYTEICSLLGNCNLRTFLLDFNSRSYETRLQELFPHIEFDVENFRQERFASLTTTFRFSK